MQKGAKLFGFVLSSIILLSVFSVIVIAPEETGDEVVGDIKEGSCIDECNDFWSSAMPSCPGASRTDCINDHCECYYEDDEPQYGEGEGPGEPGDYEGEPPSEGEPEPEPEPEGGGEVTGGVIITGNAFLDYYLG